MRSQLICMVIIGLGEHSCEIVLAEHSCENMLFDDIKDYTKKEIKFSTCFLRMFGGGNARFGIFREGKMSPIFNLKSQKVLL